MPRKDAGTTPISAQAQQDFVTDGIDTYELPKSLVTKIAKSAIPDNAKLQKETVLSLVKGSTVFINYLAATAHDVAQSKQHKSISASDVLRALEIIEFGDLVGGLSGELLVYRENAKTDKGRKSGAASAPGKAASARASASKAASTKASSSKPKPAPSISAPVRGKEKEKATASPFTSVPRPVSSVSAVPNGGEEDGVEEDGLDEGDEGMEEGEGELDEAEDENVDDEEDGVEEDIEEDEDEPEDEQDPAGADAMALEEDELRRDARGLEGAAGGDE
ncbi:histone-fold-containing protein [Hygrophoropsis aurantiaca]|uniref:Histone-fold-containing protein n=1 Tax=Hygrophoropsis aurantiaca TaxID=72124 RepID=A0ACB8A9E9_9AGAM|nr:histone-fold-containing protein [Hygrophoropsis aurantiaca]